MGGSVSVWVAESLGAPPGFSLSAWAYYEQLRGSRRAHVYRTVIDLFFLVVCLEVDHCQASFIKRARRYMI